MSTPTFKPRRLSHHLVLALTLEEPSTPDEICRRYESRFGSFAPDLARASMGRVLCQLVDAGCIVASESGGQALEYRATKAGADEHGRWLRSEIDLSDWPRELLARIATAAPLGRGLLLELVGHYRALAWGRFSRLQSHADTAPGIGELAELVSQLVADEQAVIVGAQLTWAEDALKALNDTST